MAGEGRRRHPLSLTDRQLEAIEVALTWALVDTDDLDGRQVRRLAEAQDKVRAELRSRDLIDGAGLARYRYPRGRLPGLGRRY